jgi:hypothetical protein
LKIETACGRPRSFNKSFNEIIYTMQCERLIKLIKTWYINVRDETMAPARMISFIEQHIATCSVCQQDPDIHDEIAKITEIVLPESKIPKAIRSSQSDDEDLDDDDLDDDDLMDEDEEDEEDLGDDLDDEDMDDDLDDDSDLLEPDDI